MAEQLVFVNFPVSDLARARAFYAALGFSFDPRFSDDTVACVVVSPAIFIMLMLRERFATFAPHPVGDPTRESLVLVSLSRASRADVIAFVETGVAAGGATIGDVDELADAYYGASVADPDGNPIGVMWMDMARMAPTLPGEMDAAVDA